VIAVYVIPEDASLAVDELDRFCREHPMLVKFKLPRHNKFVNEIPYTAREITS
jgi:non-ribosomal peptide synthetase component E (peptide arylation enzyme)